MRFDGRIALLIPEGGTLKASCGGETVLTVENGLCTVHTRFPYDCPRYKAGTPLSYSLDGEAGEWLLAIEPQRIALYVNGKPDNEEWPQGELPKGEWDMEGEYRIAEMPAETEKSAPLTVPARFFCPPGRNTGTGDCMPFSRNGEYCVYYLFDRRGHHSKGGLGAHQWCQISTKDLVHWTSHPMAVPIEEMNEASICTGSLLSHHGIVSAFFAVRTTDGTAAKLTRADSPDGIRFRKTDMDVSLTSPYEPVSARDPMVFFGEDGRYHMLVTTSLETGEGCLAHLVSDDVTRWIQQDPFIVPGYKDQPECSDYFKWGKYWYLVFSNGAVARYRLSEGPFGPWIKPRRDVLDSVESAVCKTAAFGDRRLVTGFLNRLPRSYAGNMVTHELFQSPDGTLTSGFVEEMMPRYPLRVEDAWRCSATDRGTVTLDEGVSCACISLRADGAAWEWGIELEQDGKTDRLVYSRDDRCLYFQRDSQSFFGPEWRNMLMNMDITSAELLLEGDILDISAEGRVMTVRLETAGAKKVRLFSRGAKSVYTYRIMGE